MDFRFHSGTLKLTTYLRTGLHLWTTDEDHMYVDFIRGGLHGNGAARMGNAHWRRLTELRAGAARSVFHFDVQGSAAKSTHTGIPWLRYIRHQLGGGVHFWPFDGWDIPPGRSAVVEVYPALWKHAYSIESRTGDHHDVYVVATWLRELDQDGRLRGALGPNLSPADRLVAKAEGWILGVG
jgi:hypothetical protein